MPRGIKRKESYIYGKDFLIWLSNFIDALPSRVSIHDNQCWQYGNQDLKHPAKIKLPPCRGASYSARVSRLILAWRHGVGFLRRNRKNGIAMHLCDNHWCVNPEHIKAGTQAENVRDCLLKGRRRGPVNHYT